MSSPLQSNVVAALRDRAETSPERLAFRSLREGGAADTQSYSWRRWWEESRCLAAWLAASGLRRGDRVAILGGNTPLWPVADLGVLMAGGISVGIYPTSSAVQLRGLLADSGAAVLIADAAAASLVTAGWDHRLNARLVIQSEAANSLHCAMSWNAALAAGRQELSGGGGAGDDLDRRIAAIRPGDVAVIIYTSGSTGAPKGACLTHETITASAASIASVLQLCETDTALSFLPFCHAAERIFGLYTRIFTGMQAGMVADYQRLPEAARAYNPTVFGGLPRFYEKIHAALTRRAAEASGAERAAWECVARLGARRSRLQRAGHRVPGDLEGAWQAARTLISGHVAGYLGDSLRVATSGGAALPLAVAEYFDGLGIPILGGYGLTEHLCAAFNRPDSYRLDAAGPAMPGAEIRIAQDGEILLRRTALCFAGYHLHPADTDAAFTPDGEWLLTGDLGSLDEAGVLTVTGRKKELIALSNGKKIAPLPVEARLATHPWISQAVLHGEGRNFVSALLTVNPDAITRWAQEQEQGLAAELPELLEHPLVVAEFQAAVDAVNETLSRPEQVRRFVLLAHEFSAEDGELTPTHKVRREVVAERYGALLDPLYG